MILPLALAWERTPLRSCCPGSRLSLLPLYEHMPLRCLLKWLSAARYDGCLLPCALLCHFRVPSFVHVHASCCSSAANMGIVCVLGCLQVGRLFVHIRLLAALPAVLRHSGNVLLFCLFVSISRLYSPKD